MLNQAEYFVKTQATDVPEIQASVEAISRYITEGDYHPSKDARLAQWACYEGDLYELVISIFTICLQGQQTYQGLIGMLAGKIPMKNKLDRLQTIAEVIAVVSNTGLIRITKMGKGRSILVDTEYALENIPVMDRHEVLMSKPEKITENSTDEEGSMFLGSHFNFHKGEICLDHLNRMNSVELALNIPFLCKIEEEREQKTEQEFTLTYKGKTSPSEAYRGYLEQWDAFTKESKSRYLGIGERTFHQLHKYDARGRCYAVGYHVTYQGASFKKAIVQLANKEKLNQE